MKVFLISILLLASCIQPKYVCVYEVYQGSVVVDKVSRPGCRCRDSYTNGASYYKLVDMITVKSPKNSE